MPNSIQTRPIHDESVGDQTRINMEEIYKKFSSIYSRDNLGLNNRTVSTNTTLNNEDAIVIANTTGGAITLTLPLANSWGSNKTPILVLVRNSATNALTINASGSDTITYLTNTFPVSGTSLVSRGITPLVSDGVSNWWSLTDQLELFLNPVKTLVGAGVLTILDKLVICSNSGANYNVTLPAANAAGGLGQTIQIQRDGAGAAIVATIIPAGADALIVDAGKAAALAVGNGCTVFSNGTNSWFLH